MGTTRAIVLARGLGTRMRAADPDAQLTAEQQRAADAGLKAMIPMHGRPFMDFVLSTLGDAGIFDVGLVAAPDHEALRRHYVDDAPPARIRLSFIVQREALGTADAVLAAEAWAAGEPFVVVNGDNLYPVAALLHLASLDEPGLLAFEAGELVRSGNIPAERLAAFAAIELDAGGYLTGITEKPSEHTAAGAPHPLISMNCWRFDARIFQACRDVPRSARGEYELPQAVALALWRGMRFKAIRASGPVLDLSRRADAIDVARRLAGVVARP